MSNAEFYRIFDEYLLDLTAYHNCLVFKHNMSTLLTEIKNSGKIFMFKTITKEKMKQGYGIQNDELILIKPVAPVPASKDFWEYLQGNIMRSVQWFFSMSQTKTKDSLIAPIGNIQHYNLIHSFNQNPVKTISKWIEELEVEQQLEAIMWLITQNKNLLSPVEIGNVLGEPVSEKYDWVGPFRKYYMENNFNFANQDFYSALKTFLQSDFKLPGEAQKIDRLMQEFANKYMTDNPGCKDIASADAAYVLSFAMIMLNTDLANPGVKNKMTLEQFKNNLRNCNDNESFNSEFLTSIYNRIKTNSFMWEDNTFESHYREVKINLDQVDSLKVIMDGLPVEDAASSIENHINMQSTPFPFKKRRKIDDVGDDRDVSNVVELTQTSPISAANKMVAPLEQEEVDLELPRKRKRIEM